jgi:hypothetical protein
LSRPRLLFLPGFEYGVSAKWLELLKEIAPRVMRAAVLRDPEARPNFIIRWILVSYFVNVQKRRDGPSWRGQAWGAMTRNFKLLSVDLLPRT